MPTAVVINPADDEAIDLVQDTTDRYLGPGPFGSRLATLWAVPRIIPPACPAGTAM